MVKKITKIKDMWDRPRIISTRPYPEGGRPGYDPNEKELELWTQEYLDFVNTVDCLKVYQFAHLRHIDENTMNAWADKYPPLKKAIDYAWGVIGDRREILAFQGKGNPMIAIRTMPMYDKRYKQMMEWEAALRKQNENEGGTKIIVVEKYPSSDLVPEKK